MCMVTIEDVSRMVVADLDAANGGMDWRGWWGEERGVMAWNLRRWQKRWTTSCAVHFGASIRSSRLLNCASLSTVHIAFKLGKKTQAFFLTLGTIPPWDAISWSSHWKVLDHMRASLRRPQPVKTGDSVEKMSNKGFFISYTPCGRKWRLELFRSGGSKAPKISSHVNEQLTTTSSYFSLYELKLRSLSYVLLVGLHIPCNKSRFASMMLLCLFQAWC